MLYTSQGKCCDSISFLMPCVLPYASRAASQFQNMLGRTVEILYSCHTSLIPSGETSALRYLFIFILCFKSREKKYISFCVLDTTVLQYLQYLQSCSLLQTYTQFHLSCDLSLNFKLQLNNIVFFIFVRDRRVAAKGLAGK